VDIPFAEREDELHELARRMTGFGDFGDLSYRTGLRMLLRALDIDPKLTPMGRDFAFGTVLGTLTARLYTQEGWTRRPACLGEAIQQPLVITGMPRTGTTALHKMMSMDAQFQGLDHWLTETPMIRPPRSTWDSIHQFRASAAALEEFFTRAPEMRVAHDIAADEVDECLEVLRQDFVSNRFASGIYIPSYDEWFLKQDELPSYRRFADVMRLIGADQPKDRWLLKNPGHITQLGALFTVFPDACVIQTHRDPVQAIPSLCSTLAMSRNVYEGGLTPTEVIGPRECGYWARGVAAAEDYHARRPNQFFDVDHRQLLLHPMETVQGIYNFFGLTLSPEVRERMQRWNSESSLRKRGTHRYERQVYGMTETDIVSRFADYRARHGFEL
jgi:hypothetical protein